MFKAADEEFHTSSQYKVPSTWPGPGLPALPLPDISGAEAGWLGIDFCKHPLIYTNFIREYCREDNTSVDFAVLKNTQRDWYHAPWMHASNNRRELAIRAFHPGWENWAIGFYNSPDLKFPKGTCVFKILLTTATDEQVFTTKCAPAWPAVTSPQPETKSAPPNGKDRNDFHGEVRLIQGDFAVVFGTFMNHSFAAPMVQSGKLVDNNQMNAPNAGTLAGKSARVIRIATDFLGRFENVKAGEPFSNRGALTADYSLQFTAGWANHQTWVNSQPKPNPNSCCWSSCRIQPFGSAREGDLGGSRRGKI
ncbi:hypothetical protein B0H14DRAFT_2615801 [Mycena olivaceomarginata]|nr:hypothetical protein B0H14DRAFT_2615801 [Mycena olivaceomarginata]